MLPVTDVGTPEPQKALGEREGIYLIFIFVDCVYTFSNRLYVWLVRKLVGRPFYNPPRHVQLPRLLERFFILNAVLSVDFMSIIWVLVPCQFRVVYG